MSIIPHVTGDKTVKPVSHKKMVAWAHAYHSIGLNALPLKDPSRTDTKQPAIRWKYGPMGNFTEEEFTDEMIDDAAEGLCDFGAPGYTHGIIAITGINYIRVIDLDKVRDDTVVDQILADLKLTPDYQWVVQSGSLAGWHIEVVCDDDEELIYCGFEKDRTDSYGCEYAKSLYVMKALDKDRFDHAELRWSGNCFVLPPSVHPSGNRYRFRNGTPTYEPAKVKAWDIAKALISIAHMPERAGVREGKESFDDGSAPIDIDIKDETRYAVAALRNICNEIANSGEGGRNNLLIARACKILEFVNGGCLNREHALSELALAAEKCGLPERQTWDTLKSAERMVGNKKRYSPKPDPQYLKVHKANSLPAIKASEYKIVKATTGGGRGC